MGIHISSSCSGWIQQEVAGEGLKELGLSVSSWSLLHDSWLITLAELIGTLELILGHLLLEELIYKLRSFFLLHVRHVNTAGLLIRMTLKVSVLKVAIDLTNSDIDRRDGFHKSVLLLQARLPLSRLELAHWDIAFSKLTLVINFAAVCCICVPLILLRNRLVCSTWPRLHRLSISHRRMIVYQVPVLI